MAGDVTPCYEDPPSCADCYEHEDCHCPCHAAFRGDA